MNTSYDQCGMTISHHPDCECDICQIPTDKYCLRPATGTVIDSKVRVCADCAKQMELEDFEVNFDIKETL